MPKVNVYSLERKARPVFTENFSGPGVGDFEISFTGIGAAAVIAAQEEATKLYQKHWTGYGDPDGEDYVPPDHLPPVGGKTVHLSENYLVVACICAYAQTNSSSAERYTPIEIVTLMQDDDLAGQFAMVTAKISGAGVDVSPLEPSEMKSTDTVSEDSEPCQNSSNEQTGS